MSLLDVQNFTARIYTDENIRREFSAAPQKIGKQNNLTETEIAELVEILPDEINFFADSLRWKRLREVEKLLPLTKRIFAADFEVLFNEFSNGFTPTSIKKHLEDAIRFVKFLGEHETGWKSDAAQFESAKLEFYALGKNFVFRRFDYDVKRIARRIHDAPTNFERRKTFAVWLRVGKREFVF